MAVAITIAVVCAAGVIFYLRMLIALCLERKYTWIAYLIRVHPNADEYSITEADDALRNPPRAA